MSWSCRAMLSESQVLWEAKLQHRLNSQLSSETSVKVRALMGGKWHPEKWNGNLWLDPDEPRDIDLDVTKLSSPIEMALPPLAMEFNPSFPKEPVMISTELAALQETDNPLQNLPQSPFFVSRPVTNPINKS